MVNYLKWIIIGVILCLHDLILYIGYNPCWIYANACIYQFHTFLCLYVFDTYTRACSRLPTNILDTPQDRGWDGVYNQGLDFLYRFYIEFFESNWAMYIWDDSAPIAWIVAVLGQLICGVNEPHIFSVDYVSEIDDSGEIFSFKDIYMKELENRSNLCKETSELDIYINKSSIKWVYFTFLIWSVRLMCNT